MASYSETITDQGYFARMQRNASRADNPHAIGSGEHKLWLKGWRIADRIIRSDRAEELTA